MPRIAEHCRARPHELQCDWPDECYVQWGGNGLVVGEEGLKYKTAFFEAFPNDNSSDFIRGEGKTIVEAELAAHNRWLREKDCEHGPWQRRGYTNSLGRCAKCGARKSVFKPVYPMGEWKRPITASEDWLTGGADEDRPRDPRSERYRFKLRVRKRHFGVRQPGAAGGMMGLIERIADSVSRETEGENDEIS